MSLNKAFGTGLSLILLVLVAVPAAAADGVIYNGIDAWITPGDGSSWADFSADPIPAGFFCSDSKAWSGRIAWQGVPLVTSPPDALGAADTIIHRLDDAVFDRDGVAATRVQVAALSLAGIKPIKTSCGSFDVRVVLAPVEQPVTDMRISRNDKLGGTFEAPLVLDVRLRFTPVEGKSSEVLEIDHRVSFPPAGDFRWSSKPDKIGSDKLRGFLLVDTEGDDKPDTFLPGTSNFFPAGRDLVPGEKQLQVPISLPGGCGGSSCHSNDTDCHCPVPAE